MIHYTHFTLFYKVLGTAHQLRAHWMTTCILGRSQLSLADRLPAVMDPPEVVAAAAAPL